MITISLCMIVKNEEETLERCLRSVRDLVEEIIVVDTGSTDATVEIAKAYADKVCTFSWRDDFAAARNFAFAQGTMEYLMWLDADDVLEEADRVCFLAEKAALTSDVDVVMMPYHTAFHPEGAPAFTYDRERLLRRKRGFRWEGAVHECITPAGKVIRWEAAVSHKKTGPGDPDRNLRIYEGLLAQGKRLSPREQFYYARELTYHRRDEAAAASLETFMDQGAGWIEDLRQACMDLSGCYERLGKPQKAFAALTRGLWYGPPRAELCCALGASFFERRLWDGAAYWYKRALEAPETSGGFSQPECRGFLPLIQLCVCYYHLGDRALSEEYNRRAGLLRPDSPAYRHNLAFFQGEA